MIKRILHNSENSSYGVFNTTTAMSLNIKNVSLSLNPEEISKIALLLSRFNSHKNKKFAYFRTFNFPSFKDSNIRKSDDLNLSNCDINKGKLLCFIILFKNC